MRTVDDIQAYLSRSAHPHRDIAENTWLIGDASGTRENLVVRLTGDLVLFRMKVLDLSGISPAKERDFLRRMLELNATGLAHCAYCIADNALLLTATLLLENLDYNEFAAVIEDFIMAVANHHAEIAKFHA